ncbi:hypothetical protein EJB05_00212, partial [Eragrostis curvula]
MEDATSVHPAFFTWDALRRRLNSHGGTHMHLILAEELAAEATHLFAAPSSSSAHSGPWVEWEEAVSCRAALRCVFVRIDVLADLACACGEVTLPRCACLCSSVTALCVCSTAVVAVLVGDRIVVAYCGDFSAVLCRGPARAALGRPQGT